MGLKKGKKIKKTMTFYGMCHGLNPPYSVIICPEFICEALRRRINIKDTLPNLLQASAFPVVTRCIAAILKGKDDGSGLMARRMHHVPCCHSIPKRTVFREEEHSKRKSKNAESPNDNAEETTIESKENQKESLPYCLQPVSETEETQEAAEAEEEKPEKFRVSVTDESMTGNNNEAAIPIIPWQECVMALLSQGPRFCLATQDRALGKKVRKLGYVPIIFQAFGQTMLEAASKQSLVMAAKTEKQKLEVPSLEKKLLDNQVGILKAKGEEVEKAEEPKKRKRSGNPNPLSIKKGSKDKKTVKSEKESPQLRNKKIRRGKRRKKEMLPETFGNNGNFNVANNDA